MVLDKGRIREIGTHAELVRLGGIYQRLHELQFDARGHGSGAVSVRSMTGFARVRRMADEGEIAISLKSVNHRGLDLHFHMPAEFDAIEHEVRAIVKSAVARGHVQVHVAFMPAGGDRGRG